MKNFEQLLKSPRSNNDTSGLGYTSTKEGESSKATKERSEKGKNTKLTCNFCGKKIHTSNVWKSKNANQPEKSKNMGHCHKCNKQGCQAQDCRAPRFEGHCYNHK